MDTPTEIKSRLPIEELVASYCQLQKKGRNFVALCPFHNDTHPSLLVSPDKGIAYCFACQTGGDIFSFYQKIEGCNFREALRDLAERVGVELKDTRVEPVPRDEKERVQSCLEAALAFYREQLKVSLQGQEYLRKRGVTEEMAERFQLGLAPDSFSATYEELLRRGFSRREILAAGLGVQKELREERIYDRFRNRVMFPIADHRGDLVAFGGRTLGADDAKYINSSESILYHKSNILFGLHLAKEAIRATHQVVLVEGYFDALACHRVGVEHVVALGGTALTEQHATLLKRYAEQIVLCLDQDRAGRDAAERAFKILARTGLTVLAVSLPGKDPDDAAQGDAEGLRRLLCEEGRPYLDLVFEELRGLDFSSALLKRQALMRLLPLLEAVPLAVERADAIARTAAVLGTTETALRDDLATFHAENKRVDILPPPVPAREHPPRDTFSRVETTLGLFLLYPRLRSLMSELIAPEEGMAKALYDALKQAPEEERLTPDMLDLSSEHRERVAILQLFAEVHSFGDWSETHATREIRRNCMIANREVLRSKQQEISRELQEARAAGRRAEEERLSTQYQQILKLAKMAG